jgi:hypothetical protein
MKLLPLFVVGVVVTLIYAAGCATVQPSPAPAPAPELTLKEIRRSYLPPRLG